jgi:hypothetical protein
VRLAFSIALLALTSACTHEESPETLFNHALAAMTDDSMRAAEIAAEKAAARGGSDFTALRDFLLGNAAFRRCERAAPQSDTRQADPTTYDDAIANVERALGFWQRSAASRADWPEARRNVERGLRMRKALRSRREQAEKERRKTLKQPERNKEQGEEEEQTRNALAQRDPRALSRTQLEQLLAWLDAKEQQKRALRSARQRGRSRDVERDW